MTEEPNLDRKDLLDLLISKLTDFVVLLLSPDGTFTTWHPGVQVAFGYTRDEFVGKNLELLLLPAERSKGVVLKELEQAAKEGSASDTRWLITKSGNEILVEGVTVALHDSAGRLAGFGKLMRDVTAAIEIQHELESANDRLKTMAMELERSNQELEEFARIASHDLNAPITSTRWLVELLTTRHGGSLDESGRKCLRQISQGLDRMGDLVEAILAHARVGKNAISSAGLTHAEDALGAAVEALSKDIDVSGAKIDYRSLPKVAVEPQALGQLFQNILANAIKYRRQEQTLKIRISALYESGAWRFCVEDNGIGIEPEWLERIFQPLQRRNGVEVAGSGIGLATCRKIVMRVGGTIWAESEVGVGSRFFFTLPGRRAEPGLTPLEKAFETTS